MHMRVTDDEIGNYAVGALPFVFSMVRVRMLIRWMECGCPPRKYWGAR